LGTGNPGRIANQIADIYLDGEFKPEPAATSTAATATHIDPKPYAGSYRNPESHSVWEISAAGDDLVLFGQHLKAAGPGHFSFSPGPELQFAAQGNAGMRMTITSTDSAPQVFERFEALKPSAEELAQYAGTYESTELQAKYKFAVKDGKLTLARNWQEPVTLDPSARDEFRGGGAGAAFVFLRDAQGHVSGLDVFAGRVRNIHFTRTVER
jgi:hypothetical protein